MPLSDSIGQSLKIVIDLTLTLLTLEVRLVSSNQFITQTQTHLKHQVQEYGCEPCNDFQLLHCKTY